MDLFARLPGRSTTNRFDTSSLASVARTTGRTPRASYSRRRTAMSSFYLLTRATSFAAWIAPAKPQALELWSANEPARSATRAAGSADQSNRQATKLFPATHRDAPRAVAEKVDRLMWRSRADGEPRTRKRERVFHRLIECLPRRRPQEKPSDGRFQRDHARPVIRRVAAGRAADDDVVAHLERVSRDALAVAKLAERRPTRSRHEPSIRPSP